MKSDGRDPFAKLKSAAGFIAPIFGSLIFDGESAAVAMGIEQVRKRREELDAEARVTRCAHCATPMETRAIEGVGDVLACPSPECPAKKKGK